MKTLKKAMKKKKKKRSGCFQCMKKLNSTEQIIGRCQHCNKLFCAIHVVPNDTAQYGHLCSKYDHYLQKQQVLLQKRNPVIKSKKITLI